MSIKELLWCHGDTEVATQPEQLLGCLELENPHVARFVLKLHRLCEEFGQQFLGTPSHEDLMRQAELFETGFGYPMCISARDGSHIPIWGSFARRKILWCFKGFYKLLLVRIIVFLLPLWGMQEILMTQQS